jgi:hypothetical protein
LSVLLLFLPVSSAGFLACLAQTGHFMPSAWLTDDVAQIAARGPHMALVDFRLEGMMRAMELALVALPVWVIAAVLRTRTSITIATVCAALIGAVTVAALFGRLRPVALVVPALAMLWVLSLRELPPAHRVVRWVLAAVAISVLLAWLFADMAL